MSGVVVTTKPPALVSRVLMMVNMDGNERIAGVL